MCKTWQFLIGCILIFVPILVNNCQFIFKDQLLADQEIILIGHTMGTAWKVTLPGVNRIKQDFLRYKIQKLLDYDEQQISTWKRNSEITRFNQYRGNQPQPVSVEIADLVTQALRVGNKTHGAMDITIGTLVNLWGFGPIGAPSKTPTQHQIDTARTFTGLANLQVIHLANQSYLHKSLPEVCVDLSSVGEGFAVDHLVGLIEKEGIYNYLVSVGGAVRTHGYNTKGKPWRIAIQKPTDLENTVQDVIILNGHSISTAGTYRNYYELDGKRLTHLINPVTGRPIQNHLVSVSVIANTALEADCWDSGLLILDMEKAQMLAKKHQKAVYLISQTGDKFTSWISPQFLYFLSPSLQVAH
ncbi:FAD:protein FMN transferase (plasmid) [Candidatus Erwinia haradaeae]|uniref:FAD:protein FMN transferase n=1 Tax=Candidatus Erwinia haradaeae TaxID=1922217 RepID=A0A451DDQ6_9GAMM|nr:FAD:protein FMN transferase [Candidatus Erwinia haradaeae]VFP84643.1 FAD:protein FMN transferase [Candidatus Erwinia haradaeae]